MRCPHCQSANSTAAAGCGGDQAASRRLTSISSREPSASFATSHPCQAAMPLCGFVQIITQGRASCAAIA